MKSSPIKDWSASPPQLTVRGPLAYSEYRERFYNPSAEEISALYIFPLPTNVEIDHVQAHTKGQHLVSKIVARSHQLHRRLQKAEHSAASPYIASKNYWHGLTQNLTNFGKQKFFTLAVTIAPRSELTVVLHTQQTLPIKQGARQIRLPLKIAPFAKERTRPVKQPAQNIEQLIEQPSPALLPTHKEREHAMRSNSQRARLIPASFIPGEETYSKFLHKASLKPRLKPVLYNQLSLKIDISSAHEIEGVLSTHHKIKTTYLNKPRNSAETRSAKSRLIIELAQRHISTEKDFVLSFKVPLAPVLKSVKEQPTATSSIAPPPVVDLFYEYAPLAARAHNHLLATLQAPPYKSGQKLARRDVIFFLDRSSALAAQYGSANSSRLFHALKASLSKAITELTPQDRFNIYGYNDRLTTLFASPASATKAHKNQALGFIAALNAEGRHNMTPALKAAFPATQAKPKTPSSKVQAKTVKPQNVRSPLRQVVFITSQMPSSQQKQHLQDIIAQKPGRTRFFAIGLKQASRSKLLRQLSLKHRGEFIALPSKNIRAAQPNAAHVESTLNALLQKIKHPVLTNVKASWQNGAQKMALPTALPDLYAGGEIIISAALPTRHLPAGPLLKITGQSTKASPDTQAGTSSGSPWQLTLTSQQAQKARGLRKYWARRKIAALASQSKNSPKIVSDITQTSLSYGVRIREDESGLSGPYTRFKIISAPTSRAASPPLGLQKRGGTRKSGVKNQPSQQYAALITPLPFLQTKSKHSAAHGQHVLLIGFVVLFFATMCALTVGLWRNFRREVILMASGNRKTGGLGASGLGISGLGIGWARQKPQFYKKRVRFLLLWPFR